MGGFIHSVSHLLSPVLGAETASQQGDSVPDKAQGHHLQVHGRQWMSTPSVNETPGLGLMKRGCLGVGWAVDRKLIRK